MAPQPRALITLNVTLKERARYERAAEAAGLNLSAWIRTRLDKE